MAFLKTSSAIQSQNIQIPEGQDKALYLQGFLDGLVSPGAPPTSASRPSYVAGFQAAIAQNLAQKTDGAKLTTQPS